MGALRPGVLNNVVPRVRLLDAIYHTRILHKADHHHLHLLQSSVLVSAD
jgi:hypothetical protein